MLHVINANNRDQYADQLEQSFRARHRVFVEQKGWEDLRKDDHREIDQFDTDDAVHLVFLNDNNEVVGGSRLLPTEKPHLLSEVFPHLASITDIPRGPHIYEWTRFYVDHGEMPANQQSNVSPLIMCGILEYCLANGIEQLTAVAEQFWLPRFIRWGWKPVPLGLPQEHNGEKIFAIHLRVSEEALENTTNAMRVTTTALYRHSGEQVKLTG